MTQGLGIGKVRGLQQIADETGCFTIAAMDHRGSLSRLICSNNDSESCYTTMVQFKEELCQVLAPLSSAVLLDPIYGAANCIRRNLIPKGIGILISIEATGYRGDDENRITHILEGWSVAKIKRMGASAAKLLVYFRPELKDAAKNQLNTISNIAESCLKEDIPLLVEPISYPIGDEIRNENLYPQRKADIVIETAKMITALPIDVLKAEFPGELSLDTEDEAHLFNCRRLDSASRVPWVVLSAGTSFDDFKRQVTLAVKCGASGFLAGRAIWQDATLIDNSTKRLEFLEMVATSRLKNLKTLVATYGQPWYKKLGLELSNLTGITKDWYLNY